MMAGHDRACHDDTGCRRFEIHRLCWHGQYEIVQLLVERGANVTALNIDRQTPEALAARRGYHYIVNFFRTWSGTTHRRLGRP